MINVISWEAALEELVGLLPGCNSFLPELIIETAKEAGFSAPLTRLNGWQKMADDAILQRLLPDDVGAEDSILVVSEASYVKASPFTLQVGDLYEFTRWHLSQYNESVVNGDTVVVLPARRVIALFHHEGACSTISVGRSERA
jgi:hypothetical protein